MLLWVKNDEVLITGANTYRGSDFTKRGYRKIGFVGGNFGQCGSVRRKNKKDAVTVLANAVQEQEFLKKTPLSVEGELLELRTRVLKLEKNL